MIHYNRKVHQIEQTPKVPPKNNIGRNANPINITHAQNTWISI